MEVMPYELSQITKAHGCAGDRQQRASEHLKLFAREIEYASDVVAGETRRVIMESEGNIEFTDAAGLVAAVFLPSRKGGCGYVDADGHHVTGQPFAMIYNPATTRAEEHNTEDGQRAVRFSPIEEGA